MKHWKLMTVTALAIGAVTAAIALPVHAEEKEGKGRSAKDLSELVKQTKVKFADAIATAEKHAKGTAIAGRLELDDGTLMYEIHVLLAGDQPKLKEVEVDAKTGKVIEEDKDGEAKEDKDGDDDDDDGCGEDDDDEGCDED